MRQSGANKRELSTGDPTRRVSAGKTRFVPLAVIGFVLAGLSPLVLTASPASAEDVTEPTVTNISVNSAAITQSPTSSVLFSAQVTGNFLASNPVLNYVVYPGTVAFTSGATPICTAQMVSEVAGQVTGSCSATTELLPLGPQTITGTYSGGSSCACSESEAWALGASVGYAALTVYGTQAPLTITSLFGVAGTPLPLTTSGGSGTGAISHTITDGTASGCLIASDNTINVTSAGTCIVTVTKAGDADYNIPVSSPPTTVTLVAPSSAPTPPAPTPTPTPTPTPAPPVVTSPTTTPNHGYWLVGSDGGIFTFGSAQFYGSTGSIHLQRPEVSITPTSNDGGYWLVASDGGIFSFGDAGFYGSIPGLGLAPAGSGLPHSLNAPIVGMVPSADGGGYFMVGADGGVFTFGDAKFEGSCPGIGGCPGGAAVAVMPDSTGNGYWVVTAGGYVTPFGDAASPGEPGPLSEPVVSAVRSYDGNGYYLLYPNGVVYNFGDALNYGSANGEVGGFNPATTIFTTADGDGYWIVSANGSVITEGDAPYEGGANSLHLNGAIIAGTGW